MPDRPPQPLARIDRVEGLGMLMVRTDLAAAAGAIAAAAGMPMPAPLSVARAGTARIGWMAPDEVLVIVPAAQAPAIEARLQAGLAGRHALVLDLSDMRVAFDIAGPGADQVLAKLSPVDVSRMPADGFRRSRAAQVAAAFWREEGGIRLVGMRSVADYLALVLTGAAAGGALNAR